MTSRRCIGVTRARSFCIMHAPDLESRIDCSSLGSPDVAAEIFEVEYFNVEKHSDTQFQCINIQC